MKEIDRLQKKFPRMNEDEVIAVMAIYPDANIEMVAQNSHNYRISDEYQDMICNAKLRIRR